MPQFETKMFNPNLRVGSYGILIKDSAVLLVQKKSGPYKGQYELPGGQIEFAETPEEALIREFKEEVSLSPDKYLLIGTASYSSTHQEGDKAIPFHHLGIIYKVTEPSDLEASPEESFSWIPLDKLPEMSLSPIATQALSLLGSGKVKLSHCSDIQEN